METKVIKIIADYIGKKPEELKPEMDLVEDLNINSYDIMSLVGKFEKEFKVRVPDRDIRKLMTIEDVVEYINKKQC